MSSETRDMRINTVYYLIFKTKLADHGVAINPLKCRFYTVTRKKNRHTFVSMEAQKQIEVYHLNSNIKVFYITASSFPDGIEEAFNTLHSLLPSLEGREFFGISSPSQDGVIVYKAAVAELKSGEGEQYGCETFMIPKGEYIGTPVSRFRKDISVISKTFKTLLSDPEIDAHGFCLEVYLSEDDVMCMVRKDSTARTSGKQRKRERNQNLN